jgi:hypothetical protein
LETTSSVSINIGEEEKEGNSTEKQGALDVNDDNLLKRAA